MVLETVGYPLKQAEGIDLSDAFAWLIAARLARVGEVEG